MKKDKDWYASWFDTPYYHILYKNRNNKEAQRFMDALVHYLNLPENATILDLACGKGRHSIYLNSLGYNVTGVDLSENNINYASQFNTNTLQFKQHDMRNELSQQFDAVFNLFTSFGYFSKNEDNKSVLRTIKNSLNETGFACIDFLNTNYAIKNLVPKETKVIDGITFNIKRYTENSFICKNISFEAENNHYNFTEKVQALGLSDFENMMKKESIYLLDIFGDYNLQKFDKNTSERLIMIFK